MQVRPDQLQRHLRDKLAPIYFVTGEETLLVERACDAILAAGKAAGFSERSVHHAAKGFEWQNIFHEAASMSLFGDKRIIDLRIADSGMERAATDALKTYAADPPPDTLLLARVGRLDAARRKSVWFRSLEEAGVVVVIWPVGISDFPGWLKHTLRDAQLELEPDAERYLIEKVDCNLLAAVQEIEKLKLADLSLPIRLESLVGLLEDSSHYDVFGLMDVVFAGDIHHVPKVIATLKAQGDSLFAVMGILVAQMKSLDYPRGPPERVRLMEKFRRRIGSATPVLAQCALIDRQAKGRLPGDAWLSMENLLLRLAGAKSRPLPEQDLPYRQLP